MKWLNNKHRGAIEIGGEAGTSRYLSTASGSHKGDKKVEIRQLASTDPLTGLANYRRLVDVFDSELARSRRTGNSFSLMLFDLDGLKKINDVYGHSVGSRALSRVGRILKTQCRNMDVPARVIRGDSSVPVVLPKDRYRMQTSTPIGLPRQSRTIPRRRYCP